MILTNGITRRTRTSREEKRSLLARLLHSVGRANRDRDVPSGDKGVSENSIFRFSIFRNFRNFGFRKVHFSYFFVFLLFFSLVITVAIFRHFSIFYFYFRYFLSKTIPKNQKKENQNFEKSKILVSANSLDTSLWSLCALPKSKREPKQPRSRFR